MDNVTKTLPTYSASKPCAVVCLGCVGDARKTAEYAAFRGAPRTFGENVVFTADGQAPPVPVAAPVAAVPAAVPQAAPVATCQARFSNGWFNREFFGKEWLAWSNGEGTVTVDLPEAATVQFTGVISSMPRPNQVLASVNGGAPKMLSIEAPLNYSVELPKGTSDVRFKSEKPGIQPQADSRILAIGLRNLVVKEKQSGKVCPITF